MGRPKDGLTRLGRHPTANLLALRPMRFVCVGATCFGIVLISFTLLGLVLPLALATTLSYAVGASISYDLNRRWTFGLQSRSREQIGRFVVITAGAIAVNTGLVQTLVNDAAAPKVVAEVVVLAGIAPVTFLAYRHWGFAKPEQV